MKHHDLNFIDGETTVLKIQIGNYRYPVSFRKKGNRLWASYGFNKKITEELKSLEGTKWHGYEDPPIKQWSLTDSQHNRFQLAFLAGMNPYEHYDKPITEYKPSRQFRSYQIDMTAFMLSRHYCVIAAQMGVGKSLSAIGCMEDSGAREWYWVAPKSAMYSVQLECDKWQSLIRPQFYTYETLRELVKNWTKDKLPPQGLILDEASRCKTHTAQRTQAAKWLADYIREVHGDKGFVILMSGTPAPKSPVDWFSLCNIACPGYLKEGDAQKFRKRLAVMKQAEGVAGVYSALETWLDDDRKCSICGKFVDNENHTDPCVEEFHEHQPSKNEVAYLYNRMKGLVLVKLKKDCLSLPDKQYKIINIKPTQNIVNAAKLIVAQGLSAIKTLILLRELSDGFQYDKEAIGTEQCPLCKGSKTCMDFIYTGPDDKYDETMQRQYEGLETPESYFKLGEKACPTCNGTGESISYLRTSVQVECPKEGVLADIMDEHEDLGRLVTYAGFTGSVDRCVQIAQKMTWDYIRVDGRGWLSSIPGFTPQELLKLFQSQDERRINFIAQPSSAGMGITLTASPTIVYYSNDFNGESREQSEDRIHRLGMDENRGATIIDLVHLPSDQLVIDNLKKKKALQAMTMGQLNQQLILD